ncbi:hypothetical protein ARMGADRAFT_1083106 [Armillaria gallica]|uniref:Uncharacterized protein n=1 Tax=Armillaria gallica TaxID=47427 RepID=A0A2H3D4Q9_ARMGA|nr:hypothetical protein ARMGADRAFT_1083106 [Armillaria gallica]
MTSSSACREGFVRPTPDFGDESDDDPSACDVSIDVDRASLAELEKVQKTFIRRLLGIAKHSPVAMLFSETGMWPVKYRRLMLALRYWQYALSLSNDHFLAYAVKDATELAMVAKPSWISDLVNALHLLPHPVSLDLSPLEILITSSRQSNGLVAMTSMTS